MLFLVHSNPRLRISDCLWYPGTSTSELVGQNLERCALADTVGAHETQHLSGARVGQSVQLERVGPIAMRGLRVEILGQVDNLNGLIRALLHANVATNAQFLRNECRLILLRHHHTQLKTKKKKQKKEKEERKKKKRRRRKRFV